MIGIGLMCIHNPCDEIGRRVMDETLQDRLPARPRVRDAVDALETIPEFRAAKTRIVVRMGKTENFLGKWVVHHGAGTNGGVPVAGAAFDNGIDTVFYIHLDAGSSDGCGRSMAARVRSTSWSRGIWLRTASASMCSSESSARAV